MPVEAHPVDVTVGERLRAHRQRRGWSQTFLAARVGITFQQLQKYESASNRVSASKLYLLAQALEAEVASFFEGLPCPEQPDIGAVVWVMDPLTRRLLEAFDRVADPELRAALAALIRALAEAGGD